MTLPTKLRNASKGRLTPFLFLLPALIAFSLFKYYPMLLGFFISFFRVNIVDLPGDFIGFGNFVRAFGDASFWNALGNNMEFLIVMLCINFWVPILLGALINEVRRGKGFLRTMYFFPAIAPGIAMLVLWKYIWNPDYGLANYLLSLANLPAQKWLNDPTLVKWCMQFPGLIMGGGLNMMIYLAALQDVPEELYEAAAIDGAGILRRFRIIALPQILPIISTMLVLSVIDVFNMFDNVQVMTGGGPYGSTDTLILYSFKTAYTGLDYGYGITLSTIAFLVVLLLTIVQMSLNRGDRDGDGGHAVKKPIPARKRRIAAGKGEVL